MSCSKRDVPSLDLRCARSARRLNDDREFVVQPYHRNVPDALLLADVRQVAMKLGGEKLSAAVYNDHGRYSALTIARRFGGWIAAMGLVGLRPGHGHRISREQLLDDIRRVARKLQTAQLNARTYLKHAHYSQPILYRYFARWQTAVQAAGLQPVFFYPTGDADLFGNLREIWKKLGRQPRQQELRRPFSRFGSHAYINRFGTFRKALRAFEQAMSPGAKPLPPEGPLPPKHPRARKTSRDVGWRLRYLILQRDNFRCCACGRSPATDCGVKLHIDHKKAWNQGGDTVAENLQTLCEACNGGKSDLPWKENKKRSDHRSVG